MAPLRINRLPEHSHSQWQVVVYLGDSASKVFWSESADETIYREISPGEIWIVPPDIVHGVDWVQGGDVVVIFIHPLRVKSFSGLPGGVLIGALCDFVAVEPLVAELLSNLRHQCSGPAVASLGRLVGGASLLATLILEIAATVEFDALGDRLGRAQQVVDVVKDQVSLSPHEELSVDLLSKRIGLSPRHFRRLFRRAAGMSPQEYLWNCRTAHAKALLMSGRFNVTQTAAEAGFADQSHLNRRFRAAYGVPPSAFLPRSPKQ